jgi:hypothetical protein
MATNIDNRDHCQQAPRCTPLAGLSNMQPCLYCSQRHGGNTCPVRNDRAKHRCLNCGGNHGTESADCTHPEVVRYREECRGLGGSLPWWARDLDILDVPEMPSTRKVNSTRRVNRGRGLATAPTFVIPPGRPGAWINTPHETVPPEERPDDTTGTSCNPINVEE